MPEISQPAAELIEHSIGCMLYGIYVVTFGIAERRLLTTDSGRWKRRSEIRWVMLVVSILLFVNVTVDMSVATITLLDAFVFYTGPDGAEHVFAHGSGWQTMTKTFCVPFQSLLGDSVLIYRCYWLWNKSRAVIALPLLLWFTNVALAMRILDVLSQISKGAVLSTGISPWFEAFWSLTISINIITTSLIVFRIWMVERQNKKFRAQLAFPTGSTHSTLGLAMRNIIESGMIYTFASILELAFHSVQSNMLYIVSALEMHSVGITFNLIIIRGAQIAQQPQDTVVTLPVQFATSQTTGTTQSISRRGEGDESGVFVLTQIEKDSPRVTTASV
ncbi:hypothetical protein DFH08DRAFT_968422 [Mycena albidolilacea]|uniref:Uncharacterized protein n=1 Tax=Mycena albidolilacea TaxID=1033008 RepID=A0AAD7EHB2_9AGAR|nr:hypothetical protein DFH08DRAFT_968422 [Mycena albidolilacea]